MFCYVMLCFVMLCYVMLCYAMLCSVMLCYKNRFDKHSSFHQPSASKIQSNKLNLKNAISAAWLINFSRKCQQPMFCSPLRLIPELPKLESRSQMC